MTYINLEFFFHFYNLKEFCFPIIYYAFCQGWDLKFICSDSFGWKFLSEKAWKQLTSSQKFA